MNILIVQQRNVTKEIRRQRDTASGGSVLVTGGWCSAEELKRMVEA